MTDSVLRAGIEPADWCAPYPRTLFLMSNNSTYGIQFEKHNYKRNTGYSGQRGLLKKGTEPQNSAFYVLELCMLEVCCPNHTYSSQYCIVHLNFCLEDRPRVIWRLIQRIRLKDRLIILLLATSSTNGVPQNEEHNLTCNSNNYASSFLWVNHQNLTCNRSTLCMHSILPKKTLWKWIVKCCDF